MDGADSPVSRRRILEGAAAVAGACLVGCGTDPAGGDGAVDGNPDGNSPPVWEVVPDQVWAVGVPVSLDLADYSTDPDGNPLAYGLDMALPAGLALVGSVISGTPTATFTAAPFVATADDGR